MNKKQISAFFLFMMALILVFSGFGTESRAAMPGSSAKAHFDQYGERVLYMDDGYIYFAEKLNRATSGTRWHTIGWRVSVTSNGETKYFDYSTGEGYASGFTKRDSALAYAESTSGGYYYQRYGLNYNYLIRDITSKDKSLGRNMSNGDHDVKVEFDAINEVYDAVNKKTLRGPTYTASSTKTALQAYGMGTSLVDDCYGITINIDQLQLPIVRYRSKDISFPNGGGYAATSITHYVKPGKLVYIDSTFRSQKVDLLYQYFKLGDEDGGDVNAVDDYSTTYSYSSEKFSEGSPSGEVVWSSKSNGGGTPNANKDSEVRQAFTLKGSGDTWYAYGEARNRNDVYYGGYDKDYRYLYALRTDGDEPTYSGIPSSAWTNKNVTFSVRVSDPLSGLRYARIKEEGGNALDLPRPSSRDTSVTLASQTATSQTTYVVDAEDNVENGSEKTFTVNIDKVDPSLSVSKSTSAMTDGNVTLNASASDSLSGVESITTPSGSVVKSTSASYTVTSNGTYTFTATDKAGNTKDVSVTVSNIDKTPPTGNLAQTPTSWTNGNVTLNLTSISDTGGSGLKNTKLPNGSYVTGNSASQTVSSNGTYSFVIYDNAGNSTTKTITVDNIDKIDPTGNVSAGSPSNGNVTLTLSGATDTGGSGLKNIKLPNGSYVTGTSASQSVSSNGTYSFIIYDNAGNSTTKSITVNSIDTIDPTGNLSQTPTSWTNGNVTLNLTSISDTGGSGLKNTKLPNGSYVTGNSASQTVSSNGTYSFVIYDNAGNSTTKTISVTNIDKTAPTANLSQTPTTWTNGNVTLNLTSISDTGSGVENIKLPNGTFVTGTSASYTATSNGTYNFVVYDKAGNATTKSISVTNIDKSDPTANLSQTPTTWTNGNVTLNLTSVTDTDSGVENIKLPNGTFVTGTSASYTATSNGTYNFVVYDKAGNATTKSISVTNIDKSDPNGNLGQTPTSPTNGDVTLNLTSIADSGGSGVKNIKLPNGSYVTGNSASQSVSSNGTYSFIIYDNAGNSTSKTISVTNIDKSNPDGNLSQTPTSPTNGNVVLNLTSISDSGGSGLKNTKLPNGSYVTGNSASYTVSSNGTYSFVIYDNAGNTTTKSISVTNIDKIDPTANLSQTPISWTNGNVTLNLSSVTDTGGSGLKNIKLPNGNYVTGTSASYTVTSNGTYSFVIYDNAGNDTTKSITVTNIDKTSPTVSYSTSSGDWENSAHTVSLSATDSGGSGLNRIEYAWSTSSSSQPSSWIRYSSAVSQPGTGTYYLWARAIDNAGNVDTDVSGAFKYETTSPTGNLAQTPTTPTNGNVTLNLTSVTDAGGSGFKNIKLPNGNYVSSTSASYTVSSNGTYSFVIYDNAGNSTTKSISVSNIDKIDPTASLSQTPTSWTSGNVTLNLTSVSDSGGSGLKNIKLPNGSYVTDTSASYTVTSNGTYSFVIYDNAGNTTTKSISVTNIDKTAPSGTLTPSTTSWTNGNVTLTLSGVTDGSGSGLNRITRPDGTTSTSTSATYTATSNGTYTFKMIDNVGNESTKSYKVDNIDKSDPTASFNPNGVSWTNNSQAVGVTTSDTGGSDVKHWRSRISTNNGSSYGDWSGYTTGKTGNITLSSHGLNRIQVEVTDEAGNVNTVTSAIYYLDKVLPTGSVSPNTTVWTNGNVILTATASDSDSGMSTVKRPDGSTASGSSATYTVSSNGTYNFVITDKAGNERTISFTVTNIDKSAPTANLSQTPTAWTSGNVTLNLTSVNDTGGAGLKDIKKPDGNYVSGTSTSYTVSVNGTYSFVIRDDAGNSTTKTITVTNIDKTAPSGTLTQTPTTWTNGNVTLNLTGVSDGESGVDSIRLPNGNLTTGNSASYTVSTNGTYSMEITDNVGNKTTRSLAVTNIDKVAPSLTLTYDYTKTEIKATASDSGSGIESITLPNGSNVSGTTATYTPPSEGSYTITTTDKAGNKTTRSITLEAPTLQVSVGNNEWTNQDVVVQAQGTRTTNPIDYILLPNGEKVKSDKATYTATQNGTYTFKIFDTSGFDSSKTVTISNIDKVKPTGSVTMIPGDTELTIRYNATDNLSGVKEIVLPNNNGVKGATALYNVSTPGSYTAVVEDNAGNKANVVATVQAPNVTITPEVTSWTNRSNFGLTVSTSPRYVSKAKLQASFLSNSWVTNNSYTVQITENGSYQFKVNDGGIVSTGTIAIDKFDREQPIITMDEKAKNSTQATINVKIKDVGDVK